MNHSLAVSIEPVTDHATVENRKAKFERNLGWFGKNALEIGAKYRGKCICIAGAELFAAETPQEALAQARAAHPDDDGFFLHYIYKEKAARIYGYPRLVAVV